MEYSDIASLLFATLYLFVIWPMVEEEATMGDDKKPRDGDSGKFVTLGHLLGWTALILVLFGLANNAIVARQVGTVAGDVKVAGERLENVADRFEIHASRFELIEGRLGGIEDRLDTMEDYLVTIEGRLATVEERLGAVEERLGAIEQIIVPPEVSGRVYESLTVGVIQDNVPFSYYDIELEKWKGYDLEIVGALTEILKVPEGNVNFLQVVEPRELLPKRCSYDMAFAPLSMFSKDELTAFRYLPLGGFLPVAQEGFLDHGLLVSICDDKEDSVLARDLMLSVYALPDEFWQELVEKYGK